MLEVLLVFYKATSIVDLIYLVITIWSLVSCYKRGFILSILSMAKWLLAYVITLILFRNIKLSLIGVVPNFIAAFFILGIIGLLEIPLDMMTITIAAITIGIAVDLSLIHI